MFFYKLDYALGKIFTTEPRQERLLIKKYTGARLSEREAILLWERIADHKWYLSERLNRDVGFHVAAVDYVENYYAPERLSSRASRLTDTVSELAPRLSKGLRSYFEAKGSAITY